MPRALNLVSEHRSDPTTLPFLASLSGVLTRSSLMQRWVDEPSTQRSVSVKRTGKYDCKSPWFESHYLPLTGPGSHPLGALEFKRRTFACPRQDVLYQGLCTSCPPHQGVFPLSMWWAPSYLLRSLSKVTSLENL